MDDAKVLKDIWLSESEFLRLFLEELKKVELIFFPTEKTSGNTKVGGFFSTSGDVGIVGLFDSEENTWNPFAVRLRNRSLAEALVTIKEVSKQYKTINGISYEGRNLRVEISYRIRDSFSPIGCLLVSPLAIFMAVFLGAFGIVPLIIGSIITGFVYEFIKAIGRMIIKREKEIALLKKRIDYAINNLQRIGGE